MPNRGKLLICGILSVALVAASIAWWYQHRQGQRVLQHWGAQTAYRIRMAPGIELLRLAPLASASSDPAEMLVIEGTSYGIRDSIDLSQRPGLVHARQALIQDASFDWDALSTPDSAPANWQWALRFSDADGATVLVFDLEQAVVCRPENGTRANILPIRDGLRTYFIEQTAP